MTFSLLGHSPRSRAFGAIIASSAVGCGGAIAGGTPDGGLVLTQGYTDPRLAPVGVALLELPDGSAARAVSAMRVAAGAQQDWRQLAAIDGTGNVAGFTGGKCATPSGEAFGPGCVATGESIASQRVLLDMVAMFASGWEAPLGEALLDALTAGIRAGGGRFPLQSAALLLFEPGLPFPHADLRVDFSPNPITDLRVLWSLWAPMADGYATRALTPEHALEEGLLEGHSPLSRTDRKG